MTRRWRIHLLCWTAVALLFSLPGCAGNVAGRDDAGEQDAGVDYAGGDDAGGTDAGSDDAGGTEAGGDDAGGDDAGGASDAESEETFGAEPNPTGNPIGGGPGYSRIISSTDENILFTVTNASELVSALGSGTPGVVYIPETAEIDMSGRFNVVIPSGFTLASNRGEGESPGGRIFQTRLPADPTNDPILLGTADNIRITGVRIEGPDMSSSSLAQGTHRVGIGTANDKGLEIDNCEISGWSMAGISVWQSDGRTDLTSIGLGSTEIGRDIANIHHNFIHHCQASGYGYAVEVTSANVLVKANRFDNTRHAITGTGRSGEGYEASYNIHLGNTTNNVFDVHPYPYTTPQTPGAIAGDTYRIHHNTFLSSQPDENHVESFDVIIRAVPVHGIWIDHNRMQWYSVYLRPPVAQSNGAGRITMTQNLIGPDQVLYPEGPIELQ
jgi:hypothetical protein